MSENGFFRGYDELYELWGEKYLYKKTHTRIDMCVSMEDCDILSTYLLESNVGSVLEFGCGLSTLLFVRLGCEVLSHETERWVYEAMMKLKPVWRSRAVILHHTGIWPYKIPRGKWYDMAFVDGPWSRTGQASVASLHTDRIWLHDCDHEACGETVDFLELSGFTCTRKMDNHKFGIGLWSR